MTGLSETTLAWLEQAPAATHRRHRPAVLEFTTAGTPKTKGSLKHIGFHRLVEQVEGSTQWGTTVEAAAKAAIAGRTGFPLDEPVVVELIVTVAALATPRRWPSTRSSGDLDKHQRNVGDALSRSGALKDDSRIVRWEAEKTYPGQHADALDAPGVVIRIFKIGGAS